MGSRRPRLFGTTRSNSSVPDMWKLLILGLVLTSLAARTTDAKISDDADLIFENVRSPAKEVAAMAATDESQKPTKSEFGISLDDTLNLDDEFVEDGTDVLDALEEDDDTDDVDEVSTVPAEESGGWLANSVSRVRRQINKLLGAEEEEQQQPKVAKPKKSKKGKNKGRKAAAKLAAVAKDKPKKAGNLKNKSLQKKDLLAGRPKRQGFFNYILGNDEEEEDNDGEYDGSGEDETYGIRNYRLTFIVTEIWNHNMADEHSREFQNMSNYIADELVKYFDQEYKDMDSDYSMSARVVHLAQTTDPFKIHVTVDLEITGDIEPADLDHKFYTQIKNYQVINTLGVADDDNYSFQKLDDAPEIDENKIYRVSPTVTAPTPHPTQYPQQTERSRCRAGEFECGTGQCIDESQRCDNILDCDDESDEENCTEESSYNGNENGATDSWWNQSGDTSTTPEMGCRGDDVYRCEYSGTQICEVQRCDGVQDCPHGEDEEHCGGECQNYEFACAEKCILLSQRCDNIQDCSDGADELECPSQPTQRPEELEHDPR